MDILIHTADGKLKSKDPYIVVGNRFRITKGTYKDTIVCITPTCRDETLRLRRAHSAEYRYHNHVWVAGDGQIAAWTHLDKDSLELLE